MKPYKEAEKKSFNYIEEFNLFCSKLPMTESNEVYLALNIIENFCKDLDKPKFSLREELKYVNDYFDKLSNADLIAGLVKCGLDPNFMEDKIDNGTISNRK